MRRWRKTENEKFKLSISPFLPAKIPGLFIAGLISVQATHRNIGIALGEDSAQHK